MFYISKIDDYLKILADTEMRDFAAIYFSEYFKSAREKLYSKLNEGSKFRKISESLYVFLATPDEVIKYAKMMQINSSDNCVHRYNIEILNLFNPEIQVINTNSMIKNKLKECSVS